MVAVEARDVMSSVRLDCGVRLEAHVTPGSSERMDLVEGREVWLVVKTHSCHLFKGSS
jgi:molybdopterin-binding protein